MLCALSLLLSCLPIDFYIQNSDVILINKNLSLLAGGLLLLAGVLISVALLITNYDRVTATDFKVAVWCWFLGVLVVVIGFIPMVVILLALWLTKNPKVRT